MSSRIPSLNWLRVFEAAARSGSFARAAESLHMSRPAVSQQIQSLERALGEQLFERRPQSVVLTDAGKAFLPSVAQSLHMIETVSSDLFGGQRTETITVQCSLLMATGWLSPRLSDFSTRHPDIRVNLRTVIDDQEFGADKADLRIVFGMPPNPYEASDSLFGETVYPVAIPEIAVQIEQPSDLLSWPLIEIASHRTNWWSFLPADSPAPDFVFTDNSVTAMSLAQTGAVALARAPACGDLPGNFGLVRCDALSSARGVQEYTLLHPGTTQLSRAAGHFRSWLLSAS